MTVVELDDSAICGKSIGCDESIGCENIGGLEDSANCGKSISVSVGTDDCYGQPEWMIGNLEMELVREKQTTADLLDMLSICLHPPMVIVHDNAVCSTKPKVVRFARNQKAGRLAMSHL